MTRRFVRMIVTAGIVAACAAAIFLLIRDTRSQTFASSVPVLSPRFRAVLQATSLDGSEFVVDPAPLVRPGDTQHQGIAADGRALLAFSDPVSGEIHVADLESSSTWPLEGEDGEAITGVDPCWIDMPDGSRRIYYVHTSGRSDPALSPESTEIRSLSSADGLRWRRDPGIRLAEPGAADPDVIQLSGGRYRMYYSVGERTDDDGELGRPGARLPAILSALSDDGLAFTPESGVRLWGGSASSTVVTDEGRFRMYYHSLEAVILSALSDDGLHIVPEPGERIGFDPAAGERYVGAESPALRRAADGSWWMTFNTVVEPPFPASWFIGWASARHAGSGPPAPDPDAT